jgi:hypothetical protein
MSIKISQNLTPPKSPFQLISQPVRILFMNRLLAKIKISVQIKKILLIQTKFSVIKEF